MKTKAEQMMSRLRIIAEGNGQLIHFQQHRSYCKKNRVANHTKTMPAGSKMMNGLNYSLKLLYMYITRKFVGSS